MPGLHPDLRNEAPAGGLLPPQRALAIGAHPDDVEFGAGGTLARWAEAGTAIAILVMTDGSKGSWDPAVDRGSLAATRRREAEAAANVLGAATVEFVGEVDGELEASRRLVADLAGRIRRHRPDVVLTHDPWQRYQLHPDHRATGWIAVDAVVAARDPLFFPDQLVEGVGAHRPSALLLWSADEPDHWEDVATTLSRKIEALLCHASQGTTTMGDAQQGGEAREMFAARVEAKAARLGEPAGLSAAEAFRRLTP